MFLKSKFLILLFIFLTGKFYLISYIYPKIGDALFQHVLCKQESGFAEILSHPPQHIFCRFKKGICFPSILRFYIFKICRIEHVVRSLKNSFFLCSISCSQMHFCAIPNISSF